MKNFKLQFTPEFYLVAFNYEGDVHNFIVFSMMFIRN